MDDIGRALAEMPAEYARDQLPWVPTEHVLPGGHFSIELLNWVVLRRLVERPSLCQFQLAELMDVAGGKILAEHLMAEDCAGGIVHVPGHWVAFAHRARKLWWMDSIGGWEIVDAKTLWSRLEQGRLQFQMVRFWQPASAPRGSPTKGGETLSASPAQGVRAPSPSPSKGGGAATSSVSALLSQDEPRYATSFHEAGASNHDPSRGQEPPEPTELGALASSGSKGKRQEENNSGTRASASKSKAARAPDDAQRLNAASEETAKADEEITRLFGRRVGPFTISVKQTGQKSGGPYGGYQAICPFHRKSAHTGCSKWFRVGGPSYADRAEAARASLHWCAQAAKFDRQWQHVAFSVDRASAPALQVTRALPIFAESRPSRRALTDLELEHGALAAPEGGGAPADEDVACSSGSEGSSDSDGDRGARQGSKQAAGKARAKATGKAKAKAAGRGGRSKQKEAEAEAAEAAGRGRGRGRGGRSKQKDKGGAQEESGTSSSSDRSAGGGGSESQSGSSTSESDDSDSD